MTPARLLTVAEVAEILRVSRDHVYAVKHRIGFVKFGRAVRFVPDAVTRYIAANTESVSEGIRKIDLSSI